MELELKILDYRQLLMDELTKRKEKNSNYSLRAFARDLGVNCASLSQVLASKRRLSKKNVQRMAESLALSPWQTASLLRDPLKPEVGGSLSTGFNEIEEDTFRIMSDWYYFAILSLARLKRNRSEPAWIAKRIGISPLEARIAVERLARLGLLKVTQGRLYRTSTPLHTTNEVPSAVVRKFHKQLLSLAMQSLERDSLEIRQVTSMTMAIDPARIREAKEMILAFRNKLTAFLEQGTPKEVYTLTIQLFPITRSKENSS